MTIKETGECNVIALELVDAEKVLPIKSRALFKCIMFMNNIIRLLY